MDFSIDSTTRKLRDQIRTFVDDVLIPLESKAESFDEHENVAEGLLEKLRGQARESGLWALQMPARTWRRRIVYRADGGVLRRDEPFYLWSGRLQLRGPRRRQHDSSE